MSNTDREYGESVLDRHLSAAMRLNTIRNMAQLEDPIGPASVGQFTRETLRDGLAVMRQQAMQPAEPVLISRLDFQVTRNEAIQAGTPLTRDTSGLVRVAQPGELAAVIGMATGPPAYDGSIEVVRRELVVDPFPHPVEASDVDIRRIRDEMGGVAEFQDQVMAQFAGGPEFPPLVSTPRTAPAPIEPDYLPPRITSSEGPEYHAYSIPSGRIPEQTIVGNIGVSHGDDGAIRVGGVQIGVAEPAEPQPYMISQVDRAARAITVGPRVPSYPPRGAQSNELLDEVTRREILLNGWAEGNPPFAFFDAGAVHRPADRVGYADIGPVQRPEVPAPASSVILPADTVAGEIPIGTTQPNHTFSWDRFQTDLDPSDRLGGPASYDPENPYIRGPRYRMSFDSIVTPRFAPTASLPAEPEPEMVPAAEAEPFAGTINISGDRPRLQNVTLGAYIVFQLRVVALRESLRAYFTQPGRNPTVLLRVVGYHDYGGFDLDLSLSSIPNWTLRHLHVRRGDDLATAMYPNPSDLRTVARRDLVDRGFPQFVPRCTTYRVEMEPFTAGEGPVPPPPAERGQVYGDVSRLVQADFG